MMMTGNKLLEMVLAGESVDSVMELVHEELSDRVLQAMTDMTNAVIDERAPGDLDPDMDDEFDNDELYTHIQDPEAATDEDLMRISGLLNQTRDPAQRRFQEKHRVVVYEDPAGNGDDIFKATNVRHANADGSHGYSPGQDAAVYESVSESSNRFLKKLARKMSPSWEQTRRFVDDPNSSTNLPRQMLNRLRGEPDSFIDKVASGNEVSDKGDSAASVQKRMARHLVQRRRAAVEDN